MVTFFEFQKLWENFTAFYPKTQVTYKEKISLMSNFLAARKLWINIQTTEKNG